MHNLPRMLGTLVAVCSFSIFSYSAFAQGTPPQRPKLDFGKTEFEAKCATCHGLNGKGSGPTAAFLTRHAADLTVLAKSNGGILPVAAMYDVIIGEKELPGHGSRDMPSWGLAYRVQAGEHYVDAPYDPDAYVRMRVLALIEYINRLQVK